MSADYKVKYLDIRSKLIESVDLAFRDGYEQGMKEGQQAAQQQQMMQQQQAEQQMMQQQGMAPGEEGMPPEGQMPEEGAPPEEGMPPQEDGQAGSELDQHIDELQSLVAKGEKPSLVELRKTVLELADLRKTQKDSWKKKRETVVSSQKSFVDDILKKWEKETKDVTEDLEDIIKQHGIKIEKD